MAMTDETETGARKVRPALTEWTDDRVALDRAERRARLGMPDPVEPPDPLVSLEPPVTTDGMELRGWMAVTALPVHPVRPGPLVRRVNAARRVSRALRAILARLVKRANL
jgi:hypothetical protein